MLGALAEVGWTLGLLVLSLTRASGKALRRALQQTPAGRPRPLRVSIDGVEVAVAARGEGDDDGWAVRPSGAVTRCGTHASSPECVPAERTYPLDANHWEEAEWNALRDAGSCGK